MTIAKSTARGSQKRFVILFVLLLVVVGVGAGIYISSRGSSSDMISITIGTFSKALGNSPYYIAKHFHWFEGHPSLKGTTITYAEYNDRPTIASALSKGNLQFLFSAEAPAILIRAQGEDIRAVEVSATAAQEIVVPVGSPIKEVADLRGKRIAVLAGTSSHYGLLKILSAAGLKEADVTILFMSPAEAKTAFETNQLDGWAVWAPWVEQEEVAGKGRAMAGGSAVIHSVGSLPYRLIKDHEEIARALVECIQRAKAWMLQNPLEAQKIAAEQLGLELAVVQRAWPKFNWGAQFDSQVIKDFQEKASFLAQQEKTRGGRELNVEQEFIDQQFVRK